MVNISKALNAEQVRSYHKEQYANAQAENYYNQKGEITGEWRGKLAEEMGLSGPVTEEQFHRLSEGQDPTSGEQLVKHRLATSYENEHGEEVKAVAHRAGWDATFSAPKSVSVTALVGGDDRLRDAHRAAVDKALAYMEQHVDCRMGGDKAPERSGKWAVATFEHDSSRPVDGYAAPQLHTHCVFFNVTKDENGKAHAIQERNLFKIQSTATAVYQAELAYQMRQLGYELDSGKNNAPEIKGYTEEYLQANSTRSEHIEAEAKKLMDKGIKQAEARQIAATQTRQAKLDCSPEEMRSRQAQVARDYGNQHESIIREARSREFERRNSMTHEAAQRSAGQAFVYARDKNFETEALASEKDLLRDALRRAQGHASPAHVEAAFREREASGALITRDTQHGQRRLTTPEMVALERDNLARMQAGKNQYGPLVPREAIRQDKLARLKSDGEHNQRRAAEEILTCPDKFQALQGKAGTGKTFTLSVIREELEHNGYDVKGFAPTARAAKELAGCGAECTTLQKFLKTIPENSPEKTPTVYLLDETSLADAKQVNDLMSRMGENDRLVLIGDVRQHESVGAGRAFAQLQEHGIHTTHLTEIVRQKEETLRKVVDLMYEKRVPEALEILKAEGCIVEIKDETERHKAIARDFGTDADHTLVVSPDNRSRAAINGQVHALLQDMKVVSHDEHAIKTLVDKKGLTGADRTWAKMYDQGDIIRYNYNSKLFKKDEYATVRAMDPDANTITVQSSAGKVTTYDPARCHGVNVYSSEDRVFSPGDKVQFTTCFSKDGIANRERATIRAVSNHNLTLELQTGKTVYVDLTKPVHLDHAYAVTSHSGQGLTEERAIINIDTDKMNPQLINDRLAYVAGSRMKSYLRIYCNDANKLDALARDISKTSVLESPELSHKPGSPHAPSAARDVKPSGIADGMQHAVTETAHSIAAAPAHAVEAADASLEKVPIFTVVKGLSKELLDEQKDENKALSEKVREFWRDPLNLEGRTETLMEKIDRFREEREEAQARSEPDAKFHGESRGTKGRAVPGPATPNADRRQPDKSQGRGVPSPATPATGQSSSEDRHQSHNSQGRDDSEAKRPQQSTERQAEGQAKGQGEQTGKEQDTEKIPERNRRQRQHSSDCSTPQRQPSPVKSAIRTAIEVQEQGYGID